MKIKWIPILFQACINYQTMAYFHTAATYDCSLVSCSSPDSGYCEIVRSGVIKLGRAGRAGGVD